VDADQLNCFYGTRITRISLYYGTRIARNSLTHGSRILPNPARIHPVSATTENSRKIREIRVPSTREICVDPRPR